MWSCSKIILHTFNHETYFLLAHLFQVGHQHNWHWCVEHGVKGDEPRLINRLQSREGGRLMWRDWSHTPQAPPRSCDHAHPDLGAEAVEEAEPHLCEGEAGRLEQEVAQEEGHAPVGPAAVNQQQPLQEPELGQGEVRILHRLTPLQPGHPHADVSRWHEGRTEDTLSRTKQQLPPAELQLPALDSLTLDHVDIVGTVADAHGHRVAVFPDQTDNIGLLPGGDPAAQHRLALLGHFHEGGAPFWSLVQLGLEWTWRLWVSLKTRCTFPVCQSLLPARVQWGPQRSWTQVLTSCLQPTCAAALLSRTWRRRPVTGVSLCKVIFKGHSQTGRHVCMHLLPLVLITSVPASPVTWCQDPTACRSSPRSRPFLGGWWKKWRKERL